MVFKVFVDGQEGTTGLRLLDYLSGRSDVELLRIAEDKRKDPAERARFLTPRMSLSCACRTWPRARPCRW